MWFMVDIQKDGAMQVGADCHILLRMLLAIFCDVEKDDKNAFMK